MTCPEGTSRVKTFSLHLYHQEGGPNFLLITFDVDAAMTKLLKLNNYWMTLSMIARIIKAEVCVIYRSRRLRRITQTEALIILAIMRKPNPIIVLLCIYLSKCSMCSLNKKYHPHFELLHKTAALAHLQAFLSFEVHLLSFISNIDEKLSVYIFIIKKEVQVFC